MSSAFIVFRLITSSRAKRRGDANWGITFKWQIESAIENRAQGNRFFLQFALRLL